MIPDVKLIARPQIDWDAIYLYLESVGGADWADQRDDDTSSGQNLTEFAGRMCYRSWKEGLNPNVTKIRKDQSVYLENILKSGHGSVLEHCNYTFIITGSRVFTHEWVRHKVGTAVSQESMRFVRLTDIPFWFPEWSAEDDDLIDNAEELLSHMEQFQEWMTRHFKLDEGFLSFHDKKEFTSFMRRFAPEGVMTSLTWTANIREIRHVIAARTDKGAEEEIRLVAGKLGTIMQRECPALFSDFTVTDGEWTTKWHKV